MLTTRRARIQALELIEKKTDAQRCIDLTGFAIADGRLEGEDGHHAETEADSESPPHAGGGMGEMEGGVDDESEAGEEDDKPEARQRTFSVDAHPLD